MSVRTLGALAVCVCAALAVAEAASAREDGDAARAARVFTARVGAYLALDAPARGRGRQGDLFTADVAKEFEKTIRAAFRGPDGRNMRRTIRESDPVRPTTLHVNDTYPEDIPLTTMPPTLLRALPALPKELAYRIIGRALVLQDVRTNMIVDVIPEAIPRAH